MVDGTGRMGRSRHRLSHAEDHRLLGKRVLTVAGDEIGSTGDVEFDSATGEITHLHLKDQHVAGARLRGVGSYAVVVDAAQT